ncbi:Oxidoreductase BOA17 [Fulvia fulva]|uniref:Oxidoreductase BOA17 n=1 Tax=Passalora fulva TaxID=5499 RepID=A0A9Q8P5B1_PASFU|nr:Oxidoreductase BOA17 [Fulvia fulva]KAK4631083.1 Oxidoreductase BOA17 [Fulvia fulva]KAK4632756.1 Oxidoreductase BOA17 [Fulvia fulva]UJO13828.1 Oxidoreductase BOA17 [Fulvia fulva]WPV11945.1 Oxidoreductase BOA17 [Fulvia fulva]WPV26777.1 Oxidoreductase BOA17 [Fulvia fulva]
MSTADSKVKGPKWPTHNAPRVWFLTCANSPLGVSLCRHLLQHGDYVTAGVQPVEFERQAERSRDFKDFLGELASVGQAKEGADEDAGEEVSTDKRKERLDKEEKEKELWRSRLRVVALDVRIMGQCQSAVAEAVRCFGRVDILFCCQSEVVVGTLEELSQSPRTLSLVKDQFETNFFGPVNIIKATLPAFRSKKNGHIVLLTAITGHLGTPGLSMYCASQWAIEGYCDSLAYEIAPFNIKMTIVQPNMEVNVLTHRITSAPPMACYTEENNPAPLSRNILSSLLDRIDGAAEPVTGDQLHSSEVQSLYPPLSKGMKERLVAETVHAVAAIGGHDNPPARHIVGMEGVLAVKEKLKTVSEELEDFVECSSAADIEKHEDMQTPLQHSTFPGT